MHESELSVALVRMREAFATLAASAVKVMRACLDAMGRLFGLATVAHRALEEEVVLALDAARRRQEVDVRALRRELHRRARSWRLPALQAPRRARAIGWPVALRAYARR